MSLHSRPLPSPATPARIAYDPVTPAPVAPDRPAPEGDPVPTPGGSTSSGSGGDPQPSAEPAAQQHTRRRTDAPADGSSRGSTPQPWHRREPWLAIMLAGVVPVVLAIVAPESVRYPLIGVGAIACVTGIVVAIRRGLLEPRPQVEDEPAP